MNGMPTGAPAKPVSTRRHKLRAGMVAIAAAAACLMASAPAHAGGGGENGVGGMAQPPSGTDQVAVNGSFENPDIPTGSWANFPSISGWTPINNCGIEVQDHVAGTPYKGDQFVELNSNCSSGITQTVSFISLTGTATVSFAFSPRPGTQPEDNVLQVYWNGTLVKTVGPQAPASDTVWSVHSVSVTGKATGYNTLTLVSAGTNPSGGGAGVYLDAVRVEVPVASAGGPRG
jgi:hypothetical protein